MDNSKFTYVIYIDTTPAELWEALTQGDFTRQYWGGRQIRSEWLEGSVVEHVKEDGSIDWCGKVLVAEPNTKLSYTFDAQCDDELPDYEGERVDLENREPPSRVTFEIADYMGRVRLSLVHDQFPMGSKVLQGISLGWPAILSSLKSLMETKQPLFPQWR